MLYARSCSYIIYETGDNRRLCGNDPADSNTFACILHKEINNPRYFSCMQQSCSNYSTYRDDNTIGSPFVCNMHFDESYYYHENLSNEIVIENFLEDNIIRSLTLLRTSRANRRSRQHQHILPLPEWFGVDDDDDTPPPSPSIDNSSITTTTPITAVVILPPEEEEEEEDFPESEQCGACCEARASVMAFPCHHIYFCVKCIHKNVDGGMTQSKKCPVCRVSVEKYATVTWCV